MQSEITNIEACKPLLSSFVHWDMLCLMSDGRLKSDGHIYRTYTTDVKAEYSAHYDGNHSIIIKELSAKQAQIYNQISQIDNPYLEKIYNIMDIDGHFVSISEFIEKPTGLNYPSTDLLERRVLSLEDYILNFGALSIKDALSFMLQLCDGLEAMQKNSIVHGDIAPQNILLCDARPETKHYVKWSTGDVIVKIIDFDITKEKKATNHAVTTIEGTNLYAAPEILDYKYPTDKIDIYSLGCIMAFMITGHSPKETNISKIIPSDVWNIIEKCNAEYKQRYENIHTLRKSIIKLLSTYSRPTSHKRKFRNITLSVFAMFALILTLIIIQPIIDNNAQPADDIWYTEAESAMNAADYAKCDTILKNQALKYPEGFSVYLLYSRLYEKQGHLDDAAIVLVDFVNKYWSDKDCVKTSPVYKRLEELHGMDLSASTKKECALAMNLFS